MLYVAVRVLAPRDRFIKESCSSSRTGRERIKSQEAHFGLSGHNTNLLLFRCRSRPRGYTSPPPPPRVSLLLLHCNSWPTLVLLFIFFAGTRVYITSFSLSPSVECTKENEEKIKAKTKRREKT